MFKKLTIKLSIGLLTGLSVGLATIAPATQCLADPPTAKAPSSLPPLDARCAAAADYSAQHSGRAILVMLDGKVVFERYEGKWKAEFPHPLASGTKSFTGVLAMCAVQDGLLTLDERACETLTEWKDDPEKSQITIRHLLTLSSGLEPADEVLGTRGGGRILGAGRNTLKDQSRGRDEADDKFVAALSVKMNHKPGTKFEYGPSHFFAFGELLQRKLERSSVPAKTVMGYMQARIFDPIGLTVARFGKDRVGNPNLPGGCMLTAREWVKFGELVRLNGAWRQPDGTLKQIIQADLLAECFKPSLTNPVYGLTWWRLGGDQQAMAVADGAADRTGGSIVEKIKARAMAAEVEGPAGPDGKPITCYMAAGKGKQRLFVLPEQKMVIVRFAEDTREGAKFSNAEFLEHLLGIGLK